MGVLTSLGDRLLARLVPKTAAAACEASTLGFTIYCFCSNGRVWRKACENCAGITTCTPCLRTTSTC